MGNNGNVGLGNYGGVHNWSTFLRLSAALGARRGEVCALRWSAVDLKAGTVAVHRAVVLTSEGAVERDHPKTASSRRRVSIDPGTVASLVAHRDRQAERVTTCEGRPARDPYLFSPEVDASRPWHPTVVTHRFKRLTRRAGLDGLRLHDYADVRVMPTSRRSPLQWAVIVACRSA